MRALMAFFLAALPALAVPRVIAVNLNGMIHPISAEIVARASAQAHRENAAALLIRINTPGGLLDATRELNQHILASPVPVIVYVTPSGARSASAGFFILEAGDIAAMAPGTNTGAASPVLMGREMDPVMRSKVENDTAAGLRSTVSKRRRNADLAEKAVREAKSFTADEALRDHLIDIIATDDRDLLDKVNGRSTVRFNGRTETLALGNAEIVDYRPTLRERIVSAIANPNIGFVLLVLGVLGVYVEFSAPGLIAPGVLGGILALLGLSALSVLPINWTGAALLLLSVALFVLEAKFASHGVLGVGATIAMILGAVLLIDAPPEFRIHTGTAVSVALPFAAITMFLLALIVRARRNKAITGPLALMHEIGEARTPLTPRGQVFVHGEYWQAESVTPVEPGARVRVTAVDGLLLKVEPAN